MTTEALPEASAKHDETHVVAITDFPRTRASLAADLRALGLQAGMHVLVHTSLKAIGYIVGGAQDVIGALQDVLTPEGTLVMPAFSSSNSDPAHWQNPPVPQAWWETIRQHMPPFDPQRTPTWGIGRVAELFRTYPSVRRSYHPIDSFAAWGQHADWITDNHPLNNSFGEGSPLHKLYQLGGYELMLGTGYDTCTVLHLAEYLAPNGKPATQSSAILRDGQREWVTYQEIELDTDSFPIIGAEYEAGGGKVLQGKVGAAQSRLVPHRNLVDFGIGWLTRKRQP